MYTILIVDDEANLLEVLAVALENMGYGTVTAETAEEALAVLEEREVHLVLSDLRLPGLSGRELMEKVKAANPDLPVVIMTAYASLKEAVEIIKEGAFDYTVKPFELDALEATIASALRYYALGRDNRDLREQLQTASAGQFVGQSPAYLALLRNVREVSASSANVLITGESGTGKEVVAKAIHYGGPRAKAPLVTINCAAIPEQLLESELFGHARGAFTGATSNRKGRFAQADGGTLFLDEIGDMPLRSRRRSCAASRRRPLSPSAPTPRKRSTCASSPRPTKTSSKPLKKGSSAAICITGSTSTRSSCRRSGNARKTSPSAPSTSPSAPPGRWAKSR